MYGCKAAKKKETEKGSSKIEVPVIFVKRNYFGTPLLSRRGNFYGKPLAAGSHSWLPAPLECSLADAKNARTVQNNRNEVQLLLHDVYFIRSKIYRST